MVLFKVIKMVFGFFEPVKMDIKVEQKNLNPGDTVKGTLELKFKKPVNAKSIKLFLKKPVGESGVETALGLYEMHFRESGDVTLPKVIIKDKKSNTSETKTNYKIEGMKRLEGSWRVLIEKELEGEKKYSTANSPIIYQFEVQIPSDVFTQTRVAAQNIIPEGHLEKLKQIAGEVPMVLQVKLTQTDGKEISKGARLNVKFPA